MLSFNYYSCSKFMFSLTEKCVICNILDASECCIITNRNTKSFSIQFKSYLCIFWYLLFPIELKISKFQRNKYNMRDAVWELDIKISILLCMTSKTDLFVESHSRWTILRLWLGLHGLQKAISVEGRVVSGSERSRKMFYY